MRRQARLAAAVLAALLGLTLTACGDGGGPATAPVETVGTTDAQPSSAAPAESDTVVEPTPTAAPPTAEPAPPQVPDETASVPPDPAEPPPPGPVAGGVVRVGWEGGFDFTDGLDPTGEYLSEGIGILSNLLVRTLVGYRHVAGAAGDELVPDLATDLGEVSDDGLTVTFRLREGVRFGPPLSRQITSDDVRFAFERIGTPQLGAQYAFYYEVIEGMREYTAGEADTIGGIETPDTNTIVFHLTEPVGDFVHRLSLPAAAPIPLEVAGCIADPAIYGLVLVASGPYMIAGSDEQDASSCETLQPLAGFDPESQLELVRNPDWDPETDPEGTRPALPDGFRFVVVDEAAEIARQLEAGELDAEVFGPSVDLLDHYAASSELRERLHVNAADDVNYLAMNVARPPFDDVEVRRALSWAIDRQAALDALGGPLLAVPLTHVFPDALLGDGLAGYAPFGGADSSGSAEQAAAAMRASRYDLDGDGRCDDPVCNGVVVLAGDGSAAAALAQVVERALAGIGIDAVVETSSELTTVAGAAPDDVALTLAPGWSKDYADPSTIAVLLEGSSIGPPASLNASLLGLVAEHVERLAITGVTLPVPSVDAQIEACSLLVPGAERVACWVELDRTLSEEIVPWVPLASTASVDLVGPAVTAYAYDQFAGGPAWARLAVDPALQR